MERAYKRKKYLIEPSFQARFILKFCLIVIISSVLIGGIVFFLTTSSTTVTIENTKVTVKSTSDFILPVLSLTLAIVTAASALAVLALTLFVSHKIAGPAYRLQLEMDRMKDGDLVRNFNIREQDQLQGLAQSMSLMMNSLRSRHLEIKNACQSLVVYLKEKEYVLSPADRDEVRSLTEQVRSALNFFKV